MQCIQLSGVLNRAQIDTIFQTTVQVRQGCLLSPVSTLHYLPRKHHASCRHSQDNGTVLNDLSFTEDIHLIGGFEKELQLYELTTILGIEHGRVAGKLARRRARSW